MTEAALARTPEILAPEAQDRVIWFTRVGPDAFELETPGVAPFLLSLDAARDLARLIEAQTGSAFARTRWIHE